ncbi:MAG: helix-turn-helix domain-containing protein [Alphaproteobacteria bacterium]|nr:helix-turn-helix domain-containing protein [Alphaproteobacteria bacterium]
MDLSLRQAADQLGKSPRQIRYLIQTGRLPAHKDGSRWVIRSEDLPLSEGQRRAKARKKRLLRAVVDDALDTQPEKTRYSVRDLKAFQVALPLYQRAVASTGDTHPCAVHLREVLEQLALGCHRYRDGDKAAAYAQARDQASRAVCAALIAGNPDDLATEIEQELMPALAGLLRRLDRKPR